MNSLIGIKKPTGTHKGTTLTCVRAGNKNKRKLDYITLATNIKHNERKYVHVYL